MPDGRVAPLPSGADAAVTVTPKPANLAKAINGAAHIEVPLDAFDFTLVIDGESRFRSREWSADRVEISLSAYELNYIEQGAVRERAIAGATLRFYSKEKASAGRTGGGRP